MIYSSSVQTDRPIFPYLRCTYIAVLIFCIGLSISVIEVKDKARVVRLFGEISTVHADEPCSLSHVA